MKRYAFFFFVLTIATTATACSNTNQEGPCECALSDGTKDFQIACGETYCVGTHGYMCASEQNVVDTTCGPGSGPDAPMQQPAKYKGTIDVEIRPAYFQNGRSYFDVAGGFVTRDACQRSTVAGCQIAVCAYPLSLSQYAAPGKFSVGPSLAGGNYSWTPGAQWLSFSSNTNDWAAGESVNVSWTGDGVPAAAMALPSPRTAEFVDYPGATAVQMHNQDRQLHWLAINESLIVRLTQKRDAGERIVECPFPAGSNGGVIPAAVLATVPKVSTIYDYEEEVFSVKTTEQRVGDFAVTMRVLRGVEFSQLVRFDQ